MIPEEIISIPDEAPPLKLDFYGEAFSLYSERIENTPIETTKPRWWQLKKKKAYKEEIKRLQRKLISSVVTALPGSNQEFYVCCFNYLKRGAPEGLYSGLYVLVGEKAAPKIENSSGT